MASWRGRRLACWLASGLVVLPGSLAAEAPESPERKQATTADARDERMTREGRAERNGFFRSDVECFVWAGSRLASGVNLDCDSVLPNNEPDIAVNPTDPLHAVASANDYDSCCDQFYTTFDGGRTWRTGNMSAVGKGRLGSDPVTTFDPRHGTVIHASLSYAWSRQSGSRDGHIVVSLSRDRGVVWDRPVVVAAGRGGDRDRDQIFHDKPWMVTDTNPASRFYGRTYLAWVRFRSSSGRYRESPIWFASSDDGGYHWTEPKEISGSDARLCSAPVGGRGGRCAEDHVPVPAVLPDGTLFVAFLNNQNERIWEVGDRDDQYLVVRSDDGGETFTPPVHIVGMEDGARDYPENVNGYATLTGVQARLAFPPAGNLSASPVTGELFLVFADNRAGLRDRQPPVTDTNVYLMRSSDGRRWSGPFPVATGPGDQWSPWVEVNPVTGTVGVLYNDGNLRGSGAYGVSLAVGLPGSFRTTAVAPADSQLRDSRFLRADVPGCRRCTVFNGDYINLAYGGDGRAWAVWTDMREPLVFDGDTGRAQRVFVTRR